jgi:hypothetical protein
MYLLEIAASAVVFTAVAFASLALQHVLIPFVIATLYRKIQLRLATRALLRIERYCERHCDVPACSASCPHAGRCAVLAAVRR